ncbi:Cobalt transport protein CbiQ [Corynebacterium ciconiae DSM 44920]|uniref:CbiQ family ECF transporter T component n=1 Tax=Corynebacterium ciconiae TaxID=227319 RepID=UPI000360C9D6|nr:CbiQ family ECF transporter T component [Corynebacterium ciconiae]WKD61919.1 Cobalt transport protein CbiQ [Corynebacterium ciconiae DSM 44920]
MNPVDIAAACSPWAQHSVSEKVLGFGGALILALALPPLPALPLLLVIVLFAAAQAQVRWRLYLGLVLAPFGFILLGMWPLIINLTTSGFVVVEGGLGHAAVVAGRSLVGMSITMLYALTTPIAAQLTWARRIGVPESLVVVSMHIYRFSSLLYRQSQAMWSAQARRLGHSSWRRCVRSAADQAANLFLAAFQRAQRLQEGLELRADSAAAAVYGTFTPARPRCLALILIGLAAVTAASLIPFAW